AAGGRAGGADVAGAGVLRAVVRGGGGHEPVVPAAPAPPADGGLRPPAVPGRRPGAGEGPPGQAAGRAGPGERGGTGGARPARTVTDSFGPAAGDARTAGGRRAGPGGYDP